MKKDFNTLFGLSAAFILVLFAIFDVGSEFSKGISAALGPKVGIFFDLPSLFIVIGGTVGAVLINFKSADITNSQLLLVDLSLLLVSGLVGFLRP